MLREPFRHLLPGRGYKINKAFTDYDGVPHHPGGLLIFLGNSFLPYDDGLTLYFEDRGKRVTFRLQWREEAQAAIIDKLDEHFVGVE